MGVKGQTLGLFSGNGGIWVTIRAPIALWLACQEAPGHLGTDHRAAINRRLGSLTGVRHRVGSKRRHKRCPGGVLRGGENRDLVLRVPIILQLFVSALVVYNRGRAAKSERG